MARTTVRRVARNLMLASVADFEANVAAGYR